MGRPPGRSCCKEKHKSASAAALPSTCLSPDLYTLYLPQQASREGGRGRFDQQRNEILTGSNLLCPVEPAPAPAFVDVVIHVTRIVGSQIDQDTRTIGLFDHGAVIDWPSGEHQQDFLDGNHDIGVVTVEGESAERTRHAALHFRDPAGKLLFRGVMNRNSIFGAIVEDITLTAGVKPPRSGRGQYL